MNEDEIRERLKDRILPKVAERSGLCYATVLRFMKGTHKPSRGTLKLLTDYLAQ